MAGQDDGLGGLAKRWLKAKAKEMTTGNQRERENASANAEWVEREAREKGTKVAVESAFPSVRRFRESQEARAAEAAEQRAAGFRAELEARPRHTVSITFHGAVNGTMTAELGVRTEQLRDPDGLALEVEPLQSTTIDGRPFERIALIIPGYAGPGSYELGPAVDADTGSFEGYDFTMVLDSEDEAFYYVPEYGRATVTVDQDGIAAVRIPFDNAGSERTVVDFTVPLC